MDKDEVIKQILLDEDAKKRVKEWILSREKVIQESGAAARCNNEVKEYLMSLSSGELTEIVQDLGIHIKAEESLAATKVDNLRSSPVGISSNVPSEVNAGDDNIKETDECVTNHEFSLSSTLKLNPAPKQEPIFTSSMVDKRKLKKQSRIKCLSQHVRSKAMMQGNNATTSMDQSGSKSVRSKDRSQKHSPQQIAEKGSILSGSAQVGDKVEELQLATEQSNTARIEGHHEGHDDIVEHVSTLPGIETENQNLSNADEGSGRLRDLNVGQPTDLHANNGTSSRSGEHENPILQHISLLQSETLNSVVKMSTELLERELRRDNQPTSCDNCSRLRTGTKHLKITNQCLGQELEKLKWNHILLGEYIKDLEEIIRKNGHEKEENLRVIRYFHQKMVERKKEITKLTEEKENLKKRIEQGTYKELYELAETLQEEQSEIFEKMKNQGELIERVQERVTAELQEKEVLKEELRQKCEESQELKRENKLLKEKLEECEAKLKDLSLENEDLKMEKNLARQAVQEEYTHLEAQINERINLEIEQLKQVFEDLNTYIQRNRK